MLTSSDICTTLEDLRDIPPGFFDAEPADDEVALLHTVVVEETLLRKNLLPLEPVEWPALKDGPLEGRITTKVVIDRMGKCVSLDRSSPGLSETAGKAIGSMQFSLFLQNGVAVQVVSRITMPFKTVRPAGVEAFDSAHNYFALADGLNQPVNQIRLDFRITLTAIYCSPV